MPSFQELVSHYPREDRAVLFKDVLAGGFASLVHNPNYDNTCAIRMSVAFNRSGSKVPESLASEDGNHRDGQGNPIVVSVRAVAKLLTSTFGASFWGQSKQPGAAFDFGQVPAVQGVILYHAAFANATGHVDLWDRDRCGFACPAIDVNTAYAIEVWKI